MEHKHSSREPASCYKKITKIQIVGTTTKLSEEKAIHVSKESMLHTFTNAKEGSNGLIKD